MISPYGNVINGCKAHDPTEHYNIPIHALWIHGCCNREKAEDEEGYQEHQRDDVDDHTSTAE